MLRALLSMPCPGNPETSRINAIGTFKLSSPVTGPLEKGGSWGEIQRKKKGMSGNRKPSDNERNKKTKPFRMIR